MESQAVKLYHVIRFLPIKRRKMKKHRTIKNLMMLAAFYFNHVIRFLPIKRRKMKKHRTIKNLMMLAAFYFNHVIRFLPIKRRNRKKGQSSYLASPFLLLPYFYEKLHWSRARPLVFNHVIFSK